MSARIVSVRIVGMGDVGVGDIGERVMRVRGIGERIAGASIVGVVMSVRVGCVRVIGGGFSHLLFPIEWVVLRNDLVCQLMG
ncbi:hypothetical protein BscR1v2_014650 [Bartonella schoenbuchensis R1]|nr:hypothetical protein BscR1v2_014650 [Bartonella schoenbuchensis R1]CDP79406.1 hypothetical protein BN1046_00299 [Bartonella schoenbuchensis]CDP79465.1 hypothetical protein BN1046_00359 [Bartonella schoenbuchensis]